MCAALKWKIINNQSFPFIFLLHSLSFPRFTFRDATIRMSSYPGLQSLPRPNLLLSTILKIWKLFETWFITCSMPQRPMAGPGTSFQTGLAESGNFAQTFGKYQHIREVESYRRFLPLYFYFLFLCTNISWYTMPLLLLKQHCCEVIIGGKNLFLSEECIQTCTHNWEKKVIRTATLFFSSSSLVFLFFSSSPTTKSHS